ncbi:MAG: 5-methylcytosine-specific restriction endonuclease system specificity protein McrC [Deltaproteobacteria bacterium]|nr:5-methylcytosine-specific restriction endonuclease system specificity protein McrC [Deltaproteobacteria bacterium]
MTCPPSEVGHIGRIPVRNLWLLMLYASELFRQIDEDKIFVEENPDDIPDLVAEILIRQVERRLKRNLTFGYRTREAECSRVRGRIIHLATERRRLLDKGRVACRFEELTVDTPRNRYVRAALERLSAIVHRPGLARQCRSLAASLQLMGVTGEKPDRSKVSVERFGRHDVHDRPMVVAAHLAFDLALPTETFGSKLLCVPDREIHWIRRLYEKGVAGFYDVVLSRLGWHVTAGKTLSWPIESKTSGMARILPSMRTDIILDHPAQGRRIVIDTKFNEILASGWYRAETLRSGFLYQIYAYLRSQEDTDGQLAQHASGLLLHPSVDEMIDEAVVIQGHEIRFATVDLGGTAQEIRKQLLGMCG